ncbi:putative tRNA (uracil-O(2)-)-methyltransferase [Habropoda laboriosa]|uniref:tRNA (uracil-O(2)-)-methyltransferase n=1 Tax=Habropoda laboriosa TaxID=597456 RepID=A0A0L7QVF0_9HYME|nr:putative tRNA (uracil-O(2)-)-methyltransferase [Habropoda laboriosa]
MDFNTIIRTENKVCASQFFNAIDIWCHNPQIVNRRVLAYVLHISDQVTPITSKKKSRLYATKQLPRVPHIFAAGIEFFLLAVEESCVINIHKPFFMLKQSLGPKRAYMLKQEIDGYTSLCVYRSNIIRDSSIEWLEKKLFPSLLKWMKNESRIVPRSLSSLSLISAEKYAKLYYELKEKYSTKLINNWPENTDPMKFVYEDIAISTYLLLLWEKERFERKSNDLQTFLDLGCGNGLLVHILFNEGHQGLGIDLRKRKIWDSYPTKTPLQVSTIVPSSTTVYPGVDWIIGNHSDELTPWIPVIAARSSNDCRFFLLPCCPYELNGTKYQRYCASKSQYSEYIDYVKSICVECGFTTYVDKLRIPSTKRTCLIGWERATEEIKEREDRIQRMLSVKTTLFRQKYESVEAIDADSDNTIKGWICDFKPRDKVEKVRNCTQLEKTLISSIVGIVSNQLLHEGRIISLEGTEVKLWNAGRCLELREIAESVPKEMMIRLRKECGGLQTLLKNHSHIFCVAQGKVEFKIPGTERVNEKSKRKKLSSLSRAKTKSCWFYENHPNGCPTTETKCNYRH